MKSLGQAADPSTLLSELKELLKSTQRGDKQTPSQLSTSNNTSFKSPIHTEWKNIGDFNIAMLRRDGRTGHSGVDMGCPAGTAIYPLGAGIVTKVGSNSIGGNVIGIQHNKDVWSYYAHLATIKVREGDKVDQNTVIGTVGNTGNAKDTWPHLHFGVKVQGNWVNPGQFFNVPKYDQEFANSPNKFQQFWLSDQAKQDAMAFNITDYKRQSKDRVASQTIDDLVRLAEQFYKLTSK